MLRPGYTDDEGINRLVLSHVAQAGEPLVWRCGVRVYRAAGWLGLGGSAGCGHTIGFICRDKLRSRLIG